jgi:molecular chaperone DnaK
VVLGGKEYSPIEISALILGKLKSDAEFVLGEEVTHAVITVPAYFNAKQKHATREAGLKAGLKVMRLIEEPTAAAIAFGIKQDEAKTVMVYDLGGGTLDITVLIMGGGTFAPLNLEGDMWLGGDNFDQCIVEYVKGQVKKQYGVDIPSSEHRLLATIKKEAQRAKEALGAARKADIVIPGMLKDQDGDFIDIDIEITRDKFEEMCRPLVMRTLELVDKAIAGAHSKIQDIDIVVMAGNATAMPIIQSEMEKKF